MLFSFYRCRCTEVVIVFNILVNIKTTSRSLSSNYFVRKHTMHLQWMATITKGLLKCFTDTFIRGIYVSIVWIFPQSIFLQLLEIFDLWLESKSNLVSDVIMCFMFSLIWFQNCFNILSWKFQRIVFSFQTETQTWLNPLPFGLRLEAAMTIFVGVRVQEP